MVSFVQADWVAFWALFAVTFLVWRTTYGLGYFSTWYKMLGKAMDDTYPKALRWGFSPWLFAVFGFITDAVIFIAAFVWWRNVFGVTQWNNGLLFWSIAVVFWKLYLPVVFGGWAGDDPGQATVRALLIWGTVHTFITWGLVITTAIFFAIGAGNASSGAPKNSGWVAFSFVVFWWIVVTFQLAWSIMANVAWDKYMTKNPELPKTKTNGIFPPYNVNAPYGAPTFGLGLGVNGLVMNHPPQTMGMHKRNPDLGSLHGIH